MKKYTGNFTGEVTKIIKAAAKRDRVFCNISDDGKNIYISEGHLIFKLNLPEYEALVKPVTLREAGNFTLDKNGITGDGCKGLLKTFKDSEEAAENLNPLGLAPFLVSLPESNLSCFYIHKTATATFLNSAFTAALAQGTTYKAVNAKSPVMCYRNGEAVALILPVHYKDSRASDAVKAYFTEPASSIQDETQKELASLREYAAELESRLHTAETLYKEAAAEIETAKQAASAAQIQEPTHKTATEIITARLEGLEGVTATVKGAKTSTPVVWLSGDTTKHEDEIKAAGGRWSAKKSAWYIKAA